ncbi:hypothetical protein C8_444 [Cannes 8 virus]|uniref:Uncharacterized protein n=1 Tax=Marseillevirus marseillevirus TaxID=694581 RepID=D2XB53_GBMV|nr:hypothetical protein MAR_ORF418 [Marseillevirus marseillevirus]ADB04180.1 hypothetical protein MAR_ORF418 [Marseillevirus marseillevirus]AGV01793.1 hypothetical protein C8_444 [Cannes 8 virus]ANB78278.1 hypothetical protein MEL_373b [Melbournevirus]AVR53140.1 hypothetical protein MarSH_435 [Marseillevirus Shanghai 1]
MKLANATCLSILKECEKGEETLEIQEMDAEQLAWLVVYGSGNTRVHVESVVCDLDPSRFMKGAPKRENIYLVTPKDEFVRDIFAGHLVLE